MKKYYEKKKNCTHINTSSDRITETHYKSACSEKEGEVKKTIEPMWKEPFVIWKNILVAQHQDHGKQFYSILLKSRLETRESNLTSSALKYL